MAHRSDAVMQLLVMAMCIAWVFGSDLSNDASILRFGNASRTDYFRLLYLDGEHLLIGARDAVYNVSISTLLETHSIKWPSPRNVVNECLMKGKSKEACHNFVRVLTSDGSRAVLVCGTNAFQPMCRQYDRDKYGEYRQTAEFSALGISPYDPNHNSTFLRDGDLLYAGTVSDFSGADPLIHRRNMSKIAELGIRTERNDIKFLNEPQFAGSFLDDEYVYIWLREQAGDEASCNRAMHSQVARLCRSDRGGPRPYSNEWTSFVKARLNCSIPGQYPFYLDQIEAIASPVSGRYSVRDERARLVYAVFRSPLAGVSLSGICAFDLTHIEEVFANSAYHPPSAWTRSKHRPGTCVNDSRLLSQEAVASVRASPLVQQSVHNYFGAPISVYSQHDHLTQIAVDAQVLALDGRRYDVLFVGTDQGRVLKLVNLAGAGAKTNQPSHVIYTLQVTNQAIRNVLMYKRESSSSLYYEAHHYVVVVSDGSVIRLRSAQCSLWSTCTECVALRDPHCVWDGERNKCTLFDQRPGHFLQDIVEGRGVQLCPSTEQQSDVSLAMSLRTTNCTCAMNSSQSCASSTGSPHRGVLLNVVVAVLSVLLGVVLGLVCSRGPCLSAEHSITTAPPPPYSGGPLTRHNCLINAYESIAHLNTPVPLQVDHITDHYQTEQVLSTEPIAWGTSTLPKDYRVKQMYL